MSKIKLIALGGLAGSGKSLAAQHLIANHGYKLVKFAGPLKEMLRAIGLTDEELEGWLKEQPCALLCGRTPRYAMQTLGTEWGRSIIDSNFWIHLYQSRVKALLDRGDLVVTDDCRFPNEITTVQNLGGSTVWIARESVSCAPGLHASESSVQASRFDATLHNDKTPDGLRIALDRLILGDRAGAEQMTL